MIVKFDKIPPWAIFAYSFFLLGKNDYFKMKNQISARMILAQMVFKKERKKGYRLWQ